MHLITHQTGQEGQLVQRLLIEEASDIARELYAGIVLDRSCGKFVFMVSSEGGVEIEKVAAETPEKIVKECELMLSDIDMLHKNNDVLEEIKNNDSICYL